MRLTCACALALFFLAACQSGTGDGPKSGESKSAVVPAPAAASAPAPVPEAAPADVTAPSADVAAPFDKTPWLTKPEDLTTPPKDAERRRSGLVTRVLKEGQGGQKPGLDDIVIAHYSIWRADGKLVESSAKRGEPRTFKVGKQLKGWKEGLQLMTVGERRRLWIPENLHFRGRPGKPRGVLVWDAEIVELRSAPPAPADVAKPPKDAHKTASGLVWKELSPGDGGVHPKESAMVQVYYTGWTTDGKAFDSTVYEGTPAMFGLANVIEGWTEGIQLMTKGQKARFWVPKALAYKGKKGKPKGTLVFDVELVDFTR